MSWWKDRTMFLFRIVSVTLTLFGVSLSSSLFCCPIISLFLILPAEIYLCNNSTFIIALLTFFTEVWRVAIVRTYFKNPIPVSQWVEHFLHVNQVLFCFIIDIIILSPYLMLIFFSWRLASVKQKFGGSGIGFILWRRTRSCTKISEGNCSGWWMMVFVLVTIIV